MLLVSFFTHYVSIFLHVQKHSFLLLHEENCEETISSWVTRAMEHIRIMKRFPSDVSLASSSSSTSVWSGHSGRTGTSGTGIVPKLGHSSSYLSGIEFMETQ